MPVRDCTRTVRRLRIRASVNGDDNLPLGIAINVDYLLVSSGGAVQDFNGQVIVRAQGRDLVKVGSSVLIARLSP